jgi:aryl-alcohol dehydrogenase-like predicted oxidoreductase
LIGVETVAQLDENIATLDMQLTAQEVHEIDRWYTPCDVINDYNTARIARIAR